MKRRIKKIALVFVGLLIIAVIIATPISANSIQDLDFSTWNPESYSAVSGFPAGLWTVSADHTSVHQSNNGQPTFFYSDFNAFNTDVRGTIQVTLGQWDDDYIGFALGFQPGDSTNPSADYLLIDWKRGTQSYDFGNPSCGGGSSAPAGLAVSRVTGIPIADEFWGHIDQDVACSPIGDGLSELARGTNLGNTGWTSGTAYEFIFEFTETSMKVFVNGALEIDITGSFNNGRLAFYNFSQEQVTYSGFQILEVGVPVDIKPESCPNPLNVKSKGVLPVAILGTEDFDVSQVDPSSVRLEGVAPIRWAPKDVSTPFEPYIGKETCSDCTTNGQDGFLDLTFKFNKQEIIAALGDVGDGDCFVLTLTGSLMEEYGGSEIEGEDVIRIIEK